MDMQGGPTKGDHGHVTVCQGTKFGNLSHPHAPRSASNIHALSPLNFEAGPGRIQRRFP